MDNRTSGEYQRNVSDFVGNHVVTRLSSLISEISGKLDDYEDELMNLNGQDDWVEPALWHVENDADMDDLIHSVEQLCDFDFEFTTTKQNLINRLTTAIKSDDDVAREYCDYHIIDPHYIEVYEHWAVSDWLANKLESQGQIVERMLGFNIWGRHTTGQAIALDCVMCDIYDNLQKEIYS